MTEMAAITYRDPVSEEETDLPVPPGYTITTEQSRRYFENGGRLPEDLVQTIDEYQARLESVTGRALGDSDDPLLVSVRSGAAVSMPGMMDTILNLGLNQALRLGLLPAFYRAVRGHSSRGRRRDAPETAPEGPAGATGRRRCLGSPARRP
jgi:phosphoenolpyruvate synthase/pyruvate phosphate dikinase